ncbi:MAG: LptF/LptG family permease [bacterium]|nr:LptF/LptG family permease [bacterium]
MLIHWYALREHIRPFFLGLFLLTFILIMNQIFVLIWDIVGKGINILTVLYLLLLYLPSIVTLTIPMGVMIASCMAFGRLAQDREVIAIRAAGVNPLKLNLLPVIFGGVFLTLFTIWFNNHVLPESNHRLKNLMVDIAQKKPCFRIKALVILKDFNGYDIQVGSVNYKQSTIQRVKLFENETAKEIFANRGSFYTDSVGITIMLSDGEIHEPVNPGIYRRLIFNEYRIHLPLDQEFVRLNREYRSERELSAIGLKERIKEEQRKERNELYKKRKIDSLLIEYHKKYSIPFACIVFVLLGCPLAIRVRKGGAGTGFGIGLLFFIFYYICLIAGEDLGDRGIIVPWLSMWFPNIVLLGISGWAMSRVNK